VHDPNHFARRTEHPRRGSRIVAAVDDRSQPAPSPAPPELRGRFSGQLVIVEPLAATHEPGLIDAASDPEMFAWMPVNMASADELRGWLASALTGAEQGREVPFAILAADSGAVLGSTRYLELRPEHLRVEIGWTWVTRSAWSSGVNIETKLLLLGHAFEHAGMRRVEFKTDARNERSRGALLALGAKFEGILRKHMVVRDHGERDSAYYSVIDDEWPAVKRHLEGRLAAHPGRLGPP
jgi:RimJ/RimL family protein N-acetyltransferase